VLKVDIIQEHHGSIAIHIHLSPFQESQVITLLFPHIISIHTWHTIHSVARGNHFQIVFDKQAVFDVRDETF